MPTTPPDGSQDPLDRLAEEFVARLRRGERPTVEEYAARHPDLAADVRDTFPVLLAVERAKPPRADGGQPAPAVPGYAVVGWVGGGGMGDVYEAVQEALGRRVALKVLRPRGRADDAYRERFRREARAAGRLHHTNIVPVFDSGEAGGVLYYAMQFIPGRGLDAVLDEVRRLRAGSGDTPRPGSTALAGSGGADYLREVARVGAAAADALAYAHRQGVLHRDVKPANLLLDARGTVWVTDFGLAKAAGAGDLTDTGDVVGTVRYMAPERFDGAADARSDVYALGLTLYELATLRPAYDGPADRGLVGRILAGPPPRPRAAAPGVPRDLETVILKATARAPADRYPTADALADDLRRFAAGQPVAARRASPPEVVWRAARRNPVVAGLVAAVVLVSVAGAGAAGWFAWRANLSAARAEAREEAARAALDTLSDDAIDRMFPAHLTGLSPDQRAFLQKLVGLYDRLAVEGGTTPNARSLRAVGYYRIGRIHARLGDRGAAVGVLRQAAAAFAELAADFPDRSDYRRWEGVARRHLGAELFPDRRADGLHESGRAVELLESVSAAVPDDRVARHELAAACQRHGQWLQADNKAPEAEQFFRRAVAAAEGLTAAEGGNLEWASTLVSARCSLAALIGPQKGRSAAAFAEWDHLTALLQKLNADPRAGVYYHEQLAHALAGSAFCRSAHGDVTAAAERFGQAVAEFRDLASRDPLRNDYQAALADALTGGGNNLAPTRPKDAEKTYREAVVVLKELAAAQPNLAQHKLKLVAVYLSLAGLARRADAAGALAWYDAAERVLAEQVSKGNARAPLGVLYQQKAFTLEGLGRWEDAEAAWTCGIDLGGNGRRIAILRRAIVRARLGRLTGAAADADAVLAVPGSVGRGPEFYMCAGVLADVAAAAPDAALRERAARTAVAALRRANEVGYFHSPTNPVPPVTSTPRFRVLDDRPDFRAVVAEIDARPRPAPPPRPAGG